MHARGKLEEEDDDDHIFDVTVIGAGIEGSASAFYSAREGRRVLLLEQFSLPHTRGSSHGGNRVTCYAQPDEHHQKLIEKSYPMWEELEKETNTDLLRKVGMLLVSTDGWGDGYAKSLMESMVSSGARLERLSQEDAALRFPHLKGSAGSEMYLYEKAGYIRANKALQAFQKEFVRCGGVLHDEEKMLEIVPGAMVTVKTNRDEYQTRSVILAPGPWASTILQQVGLDVKLQVSRAYHMFWKERFPGTYGDFPVFNDVGRKGITCGASPSHEYPGLMKISKWTSKTVDDPDDRDQTDSNNDDHDARGADLTRDYVREHFPGIDADSGPAIKEACLYTETPDSGFILDVHPDYSNIAIGCGFSGRGFEFAPIVGWILSRLASGAATTLEMDITPFSIKRFHKQ